MFAHRRLHRQIQTGGAFLVWLAILTLLLSGCAQPPKVYRVGILSGYDFFYPTAEGFQSKMTELGYVEGKNIVYDIQKTNFEPDKENAILKKFVNDKDDLILTFPSEVSVAAKTAAQGTGVPVLFANALVEGMGLIKSVSDPGGNLTGVRYPGPDLSAKRLEILLQLVPKAKRIWVPYLKDYPIAPIEMEAVRPVAAAAGVTLIEMPVSSPAEIQADFQAREKAADLGIDAILLIVEPIAVSPDAFGMIAKFGYKHKIPVGGSYMAVDNYESIFGLITDNVAVGKQAATLADKIFKGTPAGSIPVVSADPFLMVSPKAAQAMGVQLSDGFLNMANQVIRQ